MDINHTIIIKSNHWSRRLVKVKKIINKVFKYKKLLDFNYKTNYYCNIILMNDHFIRKFNKLYKKQNMPTDVLTFISKIKAVAQKNLGKKQYILRVLTLTSEETFLSSAQL